MQNQGQLRIIAGKYKRTQIAVLDIDGLRPTPDRVRETLFNWLGQSLDGWVCVDAFAGTGALGFEAASRGAATVHLIEANAKVAQQLKTQARALSTEAVRANVMRIHHCTAQQGMQRLQQQGVLADVVFLDPPFSQPELLWQILQACSPILHPDGLVYVEMPLALQSETQAVSDWNVVRSSKAGNSWFALLGKAD